MTSKEALERIKKSHHIAMSCMEIDKPDIETEKAIKTIEKDLEILEMLKKKMTIETDYYDSDLGCEIFEYIAFNGETLYIDSQEEFDLLKEWLENE